MRNFGKYLYDNFYDKKFAFYKRKYLGQCLIATVICFFVLLTLSFISSAVVIASIASTAFVIFSSPHSQRSSAKFVYGGYIVGFSVGFIFYFLSVEAISLLPAYHDHLDELFGALAIGFSIFLMVVVDVEHPPASSASLALVITDWNIWTIFITFIALTFMLLARAWLRPYLIELV